MIALSAQPMIRACLGPPGPVMNGSSSIQADDSIVSGSIFFRPTEDKSCGYLFQAFGIVSLHGVKCGATMYCSGRTFNHPDGVALWCSQMSVKGHVLLRNWYSRPFEACGLVRFYGAEVGGHFSCSGDDLSIRKAWRLIAKQLRSLGACF
jgi:hypothetical protein